MPLCFVRVPVLLSGSLAAALRARLGNALHGCCAARAGQQGGTGRLLSRPGESEKLTALAVGCIQRGNARYLPRCTTAGMSYLLTMYLPQREHPWSCLSNGRVLGWV